MLDLFYTRALQRIHIIHQKPNSRAKSVIPFCVQTIMENDDYFQVFVSVCKHIGHVHVRDKLLESIDKRGYKKAYFQAWGLPQLALFLEPGGITKFSGEGWNIGMMHTFARCRGQRAPGTDLICPKCNTLIHHFAGWTLDGINKFVFEKGCCYRECKREDLLRNALDWETLPPDQDLSALKKLIATADYNEIRPALAKKKPEDAAKTWAIHIMKYVHKKLQEDAGEVLPHRFNGQQLAQYYGYLDLAAFNRTWSVEMAYCYATRNGNISLSCSNCGKIVKTFHLWTFSQVNNFVTSEENKLCRNCCLAG